MPPRAASIDEAERHSNRVHIGSINHETSLHYQESRYREELERAVKIKGTHQRLAPLLQRFIEEVLFEDSVDLYDERVTARLADSDVRTYIQATFIPLLRKKVTRHQERLAEEPPHSVTTWKGSSLNRMGSVRRGSLPCRALCERRWEPACVISTSFSRRLVSMSRGGW